MFLGDLKYIYLPVGDGASLHTQMGAGVGMGSITLFCWIRFRHTEAIYARVRPTGEEFGACTKMRVGRRSGKAVEWGTPR